MSCCVQRPYFLRRDKQSKVGTTLAHKSDDYADGIYTIFKYVSKEVLLSGFE